MYRDILGKAILKKNDASFSLTLNPDGVPVFKSSTFSIWPILCFINELSPRLRKKNVILCDLWSGSAKPMVASFFKPFVEGARALNHPGFQWLRKGCCISSYVYYLNCSCDSVA